mgnify:CR=1 FL=1
MDYYNRNFQKLELENMKYLSQGDCGEVSHNDEIILKEYFGFINNSYRIKEEIFDGASVKDEYQRYLEQEISKKKRELEIMELQLQEFKETGDVPFRYRLEDDNGLKERQADYVQYCKELDGKYKSLHKIVDVFVGQALNEFLKE